jgi:hypothetical protein
MPDTPLLILPEGAARRLRDGLLGGPPERLALAAARPAPFGPAAFVLDGPPIAIPDAAYEVRNGGAIVLSDAASDRLNAFFARAVRAGLVPVHLHSHPAGARFFSGTDTDHSRQLGAWLDRHGGGQFWAVVWPKGQDPIARIWNGTSNAPGRLRIGLRPIDPAGAPPLPALARQKVFGDALRHAASELRVGIGGVGGLGMVVAEDLARAGFRRFVLVDPDLVEETNLHRLPGVHRGDIGRPKVLVAKRIVAAACKAVGTTPEIAVLRQGVGIPGSRWRHALLGCDLLLALADTALGRFELLRFALDTGATFLQAGLGIDVDARTGRISRVQAEFCSAEPGHHCPICADRLSTAAAAKEAGLFASADIRQQTIERGYVPAVSAPAVLSLNRVASGNLCWEIQQRIAGLGHRDFFRQDLLDGGTEEYADLGAHLSAAECGYCGRGDPVLSLFG